MVREREQEVPCCLLVIARVSAANDLDDPLEPASSIQFFDVEVGNASQDLFNFGFAD